MLNFIQNFLTRDLIFGFHQFNEQKQISFFYGIGTLQVSQVIFNKNTLLAYWNYLHYENLQKL